MPSSLPAKDGERPEFREDLRPSRRPKDGHSAPDSAPPRRLLPSSRVHPDEVKRDPSPPGGDGKRYASAPASRGTEAGASAGFFGSSAAETASSTRSSQMNSISRRATSGMSS